MKKILNVAQLYRDNEIRLLTKFNIQSNLFINSFKTYGICNEVHLYFDHYFTELKM